MPTPDDLWNTTPELLGPDGLPYRKAIVASEDGRPDPAAVANPDHDRPLERNEARCPDFSGHPCPPAMQMLWLMHRYAGVAPPWRLRASGWVQARYGRKALAETLAPEAEVLWDLDPLDPTKGLEFNWHDQPSGTGGRDSRAGY